MGLFTKKYDYKKDNLSFEFNPKSKSYYVCIKKYNIDTGDYDIEVLDENKLSKRTKKELYRKNNELLKNDELLNFELFQNKRTLRIKRLNAAGIQLNPMFAMYDSPENKYYTKEVKEKFDKLLQDEDSVLAIHRVGDADDNEIKDILINGLIMSGHSSSGVYSNDYDTIDNNASIFPLNEITISQLFTADAYKNSKGSILIRVPINEYNDNIYYDYNEEKRLKPKYIVGYIPIKSKSKFINKIITKDNVDEWLNNDDFNNYNDDKIIFDDTETEYYFRDLGSFEKKKNR